MTTQHRPPSAVEFLALHHRDRGLILPNAWDPGSARLLEIAGFPAIATTSAGISFAAGRPDGTLALGEMLKAVAPIVSSVGVPVSVDLEAGYGPRPVDVAESVRAVLDLGAAGVNLEDVLEGSRVPIGPAAERIAAARTVAPPQTLVLNARADSYLLGDDRTDPLDDAIARGRAYAEAGADCVFVPGVDDLDVIGKLAAEIPVPLNVVNGLSGRVHPAEALFAAGVARISVGGSLARAALAVVRDAADEMMAHGTFAFTGRAIAHATLQEELGRSAR